MLYTLPRETACFCSTYLSAVQKSSSCIVTILIRHLVHISLLRLRCSNCIPSSCGISLRFRRSKANTTNIDWFCILYLRNYLTHLMLRLLAGRLFTVAFILLLSFSWRLFWFYTYTPLFLTSGGHVQTIYTLFCFLSPHILYRRTYRRYIEQILHTAVVHL